MANAGQTHHPCQCWQRGAAAAVSAVLRAVAASGAAARGRSTARVAGSCMAWAPSALPACVGDVVAVVVDGLELAAGRACGNRSER